MPELMNLKVMVICGIVTIMKHIIHISIRMKRIAMGLLFLPGIKIRMEIMSLCVLIMNREISPAISYTVARIHYITSAFYYKLDKGVKKYRIHIPEKDKSKLDKVLEINK